MQPIFSQAYATNKKGVTNGMAFKTSLYGFDAVINYIGEKMRDDDYLQK